MSSEVKARSLECMDNQSENESLRARVREIEDENQELRAQNLILNRTILDLRNELVLIRIQLNEVADTSTLLRERVRTLSQTVHQDNDGSLRQITAPPLMAPPPAPPPLPPSRIRISPRQVGAGEAITTPLGVSLSSPPRHRIKRECRQGFYRATRPPYRRFDNPQPGPSSSSSFLSAERPNYFVGLRIIPQFQTSFVCAQAQSSGYSDSASDSSGSDDNPQLLKKPKSSHTGETCGFKRPSPSRDFEILRNVKNFQHQKVQHSILQNYNLSLQNTSSKFFFPVPWETKTRDNQSMPSTSGSVLTQTDNTDETSSDILATKLSDCVQYTFPTIHEGLHQNGLHSVLTNGKQPMRLRKLKKHIPYVTPEEINKEEESKRGAENEITKFLSEKNWENQDMSRIGTDSESLLSVDESSRSAVNPEIVLGQISSDLEQDGFQADESSNCMTSTDNSLEKICVSESNIKKRGSNG